MVTARERLAQFAEGSEHLTALCRAYRNERAVVHLSELVGGAWAFYAAAAVSRVGGVHVFVAEDRDAAAYLSNDFYNLLDEERVYFFPSSYKRSVAYGTEDAQGVVQRTAALNALKHFTEGYLVVCTYPEALAERVADIETLQRDTIAVHVGDRIDIEDLVQLLTDASFTRVDFVYEPGQYSVRGGIVDVFSFSESKPYRLDFFGDEVDSIRRFNISSQLSNDKLSEVEIVPDLNGGDAGNAPKVSLPRFVGEKAAFWFYDADHVLRRVNDIRRKTLADMEHPEEIDRFLTSRNGLLADLADNRLLLLRDNLPERPTTEIITFSTAPQPAFNKNFELLADDLIRNALRGYETYILSENKAQIERLENIFHRIGRGQAVVRPISVTLHEGFIDNDLKICLYTDHQLFDRYQRYRINGEIRRDEQMTVAELNQLRPGDFVVHIDHGVGRFDGLVKINENGKVHEAIKLVYKDGDVLFVNVHSLHRISRYKSGEGEPPKIYKLGNGAWQKLKNATKKAVKDISRELIALYAKRKASKGFAFSPDSYLQHELE
ncbi:MAG: transcription-repair coupling factor, partial [Alistipes sp.]|nr:transcription-repair coupling factor [Alistipes sp.]